ncbi:DNA polymerase epsilon subunit 4 [Chelonus insularis]|uniref:DNA polymerase epsilon subunit 4 n=1 Tax=Chelonus insularis TaxID=460826 RepID=UPI00158F4E8A|nr:DNA polymerase epsilon subunit 4 [Chelonus insularis]
MDNTSTDELEQEELNLSSSLVEEQSHESQEENEETPRAEEEHKEKLLKLPVGRVKIIAKMDSDVNLINQEALFLITKSTELFIDSLAKEAYKYTVQARKKILQKRDIHQAIDNIDALAFLEGMLEQIT